MSSTLDDRDWALLLHRIRAGRCTPFLGAGAAYGFLPLGGEVARQWAERHQYPLNDRDNLPRVAQFLAVHYDAMFPKEELAADLKARALPDFSSPNEPHSALASLPLPIYITTNYDGSMAAALRHHGKEPVCEIARWNAAIKELPSVFDGNFAPTPARPLVFHLHGQLEILKSMVLTEDDYFGFLAHFASEAGKVRGAADMVDGRSPSRPLLPARIEEAFADTSLLFLGYGLVDWDFRVLFRALVEYLERSTGRSHLSVQVIPGQLANGQEISAPQKEAVQRYFDEYYEQLNIRVFWGTCRDFVAELRHRWEHFNA